MYIWESPPPGGERWSRPHWGIGVVLAKLTCVRMISRWNFVYFCECTPQDASARRCRVAMCLLEKTRLGVGRGGRGNRFHALCGNVWCVWRLMFDENAPKMCDLRIYYLGIVSPTHENVEDFVYVLLFSENSPIILDFALEFRVFWERTENVFFWMFWEIENSPIICDFALEFRVLKTYRKCVIFELII